MQAALHRLLQAFKLSADLLYKYKTFKGDDGKRRTKMGSLMRLF